MSRLSEPLVWCDVQKAVVPKSQKVRGPAPLRSDIGAPMVVSDSLGGQLRHPATGAVTDSKSHFRQMTRASGCTEVGDQAPTANKLPSVTGSKADRVNALKEAFNRHGVSVL